MENSRGKIVHLTSVHSALDVRILRKECRSLAAAGYDVTLVAPHERDETIDGVQIRAVAKARNRQERLTRTVRAVYRAALKENADCYHFHDPELIPVGFLLRARGKKVIYDIHEDVPADILGKEWIPAPLRGPIAATVARLEAFAASRYSGVVVTGEGIEERLRSSARNVAVVRNYVLLEEFANCARNSMPDRPLIVNFSGINSCRSVASVVTALDLVSKDLHPRMVLGGGATAASLVDELAKLPGWKLLDYVGPMPRRSMIEWLAQATVALVMYNPQPNHYEVRSNRLFEALAAGVPVITSNFPKWKELIATWNCGLTADPDSPESIAEALTYILSHPREAAEMAANALKAAQHLNWNSEARNLLAVYQKILTVPGATPHSPR